MKKLLFPVLLAIGVFSMMLYAQENKEEQKSKFSYSGSYNAWFQTQHAFLFDKDKYQDNYVVQELRLNLTFSPTDHLKAVTRFDIAQGWWGVDNELRSFQRSGSAGGSALFDFKDTNFLFHVDHAYISADIPKTPFTVRIGRMQYLTGNRLMIDNNYDGIQVDVNKVIGKKLTFSWARVSEGVDGLSDLKSTTPDQRGFTDARDADLLGLDFENQAGPLSYNAFGFYYKDRSIADNNAYIPDHLQYFKTRFSPQVTELIGLGLAGKFTLEKLNLLGEFNYLVGKDEIDNQIFGSRQMWDKNNGDLNGYNLFLRGSYAVADKLRLGGIFGMGSGDKDPTSGKGNVNKLRTSGFFYITEVWEDSIMPDEEGITPQGLGAPNVRGYRELENTTALQANLTFTPVKPLEVFLSYTFLQATQPISAWSAVRDSLGNVIDSAIDLQTSSKDIGNEIDFRISYKLMENFVVGLRGGYFLPGDGALYLINGHNKLDDPAWELKGVVAATF